jgi:uncharacterized surface protein with fasciclin (FAS1) repeats
LFRLILYNEEKWRILHFFHQPVIFRENNRLLTDQFLFKPIINLKIKENMKTSRYFLAILISVTVMISQLQAGTPSMAEKSIVDIAVSSKDHTTLVAALKAADLVTTLSGKGPFTVFAPTNAAFEKIPSDVLNNLLKPENKATLAGMLTYHVVPGNIDAATLTGLIKKSKGVATVKTVNGQELKASIENGKVVLTDAKGGKATVVAADLKGSNGVIHVTDAVSMPK